MFIELPFVLLFPTEVFLITCFGGLGTAIIASYLAVLDIRDKSISVILKGLLWILYYLKLYGRVSWWIDWKSIN